jgi:AcrR family transcriptional regulator
LSSLSRPVLSPPALSRRERHRVETRQAIVDAAMSLLATRGFEETTVDEIATVAGLSRRTLFRYFPTKADIVTAWAQQMTSVLTASVESAPEGCPPHALLAGALESVIPHIAPTREQALAFVFLIERTPGLLSVSLRKYAQWEESLTTALLRRLPPSKDRALSARVAARSAIAAFRTALDEWIRLKGRANLRPILRRVMALQSAVLSQAEEKGEAASPLRREREPFLMESAPHFP